MAENEISLPLTDADKTQDKKNVNELDFSMEEFSCEISPTDVALIVEGKPIPINKLILALASPVFKAMFSGLFKESDAKEIQLPEKKFNEFVEFLRCLYPNIMKRITSENVDALLPLAHEYQVAHLVSSCETVLITQLEAIKSKEDVYSLLMTAVMYDLKELRDQCIKEAASRPLKEIEEAEDKHGFPDDLMNAIKANMLTKMTGNRKDAFLPDNSRTAFYRFLEEISNEQKLVSQFQNGNVFGDLKTLRFEYGTEKKFDMRLNDSTYTIQLTIGPNAYIGLNITSHSTMNDVNQFTSFVNIVNWMDRSKCIKKKKEFTLGQPGTTKLVLNEYLETKDFRQYSAGYTRDGMYDAHVYLFAVNNMK